MKVKTRFIVIVTILASFLFLGEYVAKAQVQVIPFSGNQKSSYQCFLEGKPIEPTDVKDSNGYFLCPCYDGSEPNSRGLCPGSASCQGQDLDNDGSPSPPRAGDPGCLAQQAVIKPPTLQQLEIWFVRIIYVIWSLVATFSIFYLLVLAYRYMITRGDVTKITEIRQKIIYYILGVVVVFLAIPILTTVFRLLGVNESAQCYNVNLNEIGFQFFFPELCTIRNYDYYCQTSTIGSAIGLTCPTDSFRYICPGQDLRILICNGNTITIVDRNF